MNILITGVGGPTPRSFAKALLNYGRDASHTLIGTDINPLALGLYLKDLFAETYVVPRASDEDYWKTIEEIIQRHNVDIAIILPELEVIEWSRRAKDSTLPCKTLLPEYEINKALVDKSVMSELIKGTDLIPKSYDFHRSEVDYSKISAILDVPFWIRSSTGSSGLGSLKIKDENSLMNWIQINPDVERFIVSEFLPGRNLACKMLYYEGELLRVAVGERVNYIMAKVAPSGVTGNTCFGRLLNDKQVVDISIRAMDLVFEKTGSRKHGFFTVDLKEDVEGKPFLTEVNVRHVAFTQCFAAGGANFAQDTIDLLSGHSDFDRSFKLYEFEEDTIFLRDVDDTPILMNEKDLLKKGL